VRGCALIAYDTILTCNLVTIALFGNRLPATVFHSRCLFSAHMHLCSSLILLLLSILCTAWHCLALRCTTLHYAALHCSALWCTPTFISHFSSLLLPLLACVPLLCTSSCVAIGGCLLPRVFFIIFTCHSPAFVCYCPLLSARRGVLGGSVYCRFVVLSTRLWFFRSSPSLLRRGMLCRGILFHPRSSCFTHALSHFASPTVFAV